MEEALILNILFLLLLLKYVEQFQIYCFCFYLKLVMIVMLVNPLNNHYLNHVQQQQMEVAQIEQRYNLKSVNK